MIHLKTTNTAVRLVGSLEFYLLENIPIGSSDQPIATSEQPNRTRVHVSSIDTINIQIVVSMFVFLLSVSVQLL